MFLIFKWSICKSWVKKGQLFRALLLVFCLFCDLLSILSFTRARSEQLAFFASFYGGKIYVSKKKGQASR
ncbi:hypothetical protein CYJ28_03470 [Aerococcus sanguinicola]|uniref:Uncharacterized protein n=1 Tax=Aerococcus sanguinicola TaxID=119206 RepID=A0A0X8FB50_9LACT|nr:hypothetical protein AWM72_04660 [Aerococcus sanguinicola]OFT92946.1 hypothetical protein HMPREF3090_07775 [Aerococcus sp. HMSC23C02]PKZ22186.1 hypothetical protein CYJ28_03470 [Aerococcus sanguinicola]